MNSPRKEYKTDTRDLCTEYVRISSHYGYRAIRCALLASRKPFRSLFVSVRTYKNGKINSRPIEEVRLGGMVFIWPEPLTDGPLFWDTMIIDIKDANGTLLERVTRVTEYVPRPWDWLNHVEGIFDNDCGGCLLAVILIAFASFLAKIFL